MKIKHIKIKDIELLPSSLDNGVLYVSKKYKTAAHLCCCGCGNKVVTPLKPGGWKFTGKAGRGATLYPSIGNFSFPCRSHYWITNGHVIDAPAWTDRQIQYGRQADHRAREEFYSRSVIGRIWHNVATWFLNLFR